MPGHSCRIRGITSSGDSATRDTSESAAGDQIVSDVDRLTREFAQLSAQLLQTERYETESTELKKPIDLTIASEDVPRQIFGRFEANRVMIVRRGTLQTNSVRCFQQLASTTLSTPILPKQIWFEQNFSLMLGGIRFTEDAAFGGSTRTRIVLAFHAALVELSLKVGGSHPRFLVLDTPKQHELHSADLSAFVTRYLQLAATYSVDLQLVIAATELEFLESATAQHIWHPYFSVAGKPRFFGQMPLLARKRIFRESGQHSNSGNLDVMISKCSSMARSSVR